MNYKNLIANISNENLDNLEMEFSKFINDDEYIKYYEEKSSKEHYRLLSYLSINVDNEIFIDVGTLKGSSSLALSTNPKNMVYSFDIANHLALHQKPKNVEYIIDDILNGKHDEKIIKSKIILLDTFHDGKFELSFLNYIKLLNFNGILILDDILLNDNMIKFWDDIENDKLDITHIGHSTGTGIVFL
jgi:hypothetical protein